MTQDEIIEMAHEAGLHIATDVKWMPIIGLEYAEKLINLAFAKEREECAKLCDKLEQQVCNRWHGQACAGCAANIRARSNT